MTVSAICIRRREARAPSATNRAGSLGYDANGNVLSSGAATLAYDVENRIVSVNGGTTLYAYDAGNRRVWKGTYDFGGAMTAEEASFYGVSGQKLGTYSLVLTNPPGSGYSNYAVATDIQVFFGGKRVGHGTTSTSLVVYATTQDRVGSVQNAGLYFSASSFYPYGEEKSASPGRTIR